MHELGSLLGEGKSELSGAFDIHVSLDQHWVCPGNPDTAALRPVWKAPLTICLDENPSFWSRGSQRAGSRGSLQALGPMGIF